MEGKEYNPLSVDENIQFASIKKESAVNIYTKYKNIVISSEKSLNGATVFVYDLNGRLLKTKTINSQSKDVEIETGLPKGVYAVRLISVFSKASKMVIIKGD
ncbi:MAG: T9SS type A sorting domain-containing protein [Bacteroidota bacterium]